MQNLKQTLAGGKKIEYTLSKERENFFSPSAGLPGVLFTMRYPDNTGFVWTTIALGKDKASAQLRGHANCFIAYPKLSDKPSYQPKFVQPVELDCYDMSNQGRVALSQFILKNHIKVIVFMSALPSTLALRWLRTLGVRTLNTENDSFDHTKQDPLFKRTVKFVFRRLMKSQLHDLHLANAPSQRIFLSSYAQIPSSRLALLTDGVDCERFSPGDQEAAREYLNIEKSKFWIICVAQARSEKRLDWIIHAAKRVIEARPQQKVGFLYVGDGDGSLMQELKQLVANLNLNVDFKFLGRQDDLTHFYRASDLMVHAAERESFGLAIVEAMACGLPVVACAAAGPSETILQGKTGSLVNTNDFEGFVKAILHYIDDKEAAKQQGANARNHVVTNYSIEHYGKSLAGYIKNYL
jgi:glycosyltransferase involved in cell wall biosynthesis